MSVSVVNLCYWSFPWYNQLHIYMHFILMTQSIKYWCLSTTSNEFLFGSAASKHVLHLPTTMIICMAYSEYRTDDWTLYSHTIDSCVSVILFRNWNLIVTNVTILIEIVFQFTDKIAEEFQKERVSGYFFRNFRSKDHITIVRGGGQHNVWSETVHECRGNNEITNINFILTLNLGEFEFQSRDKLHK